MDRMKCFKINGETLFLEKVLLYFQETPLLFICKNNKGERYFVFCQDTDKFIYLVCEISTYNLIKYLKSELSFTSVYESKDFFYKVEAGDKEDFSEDKITCIRGNEIKNNINYDGEVFFNSYTSDLKSYIKELEKEFDKFIYSVSEYIYTRRENSISSLDISRFIFTDEKKLIKLHRCYYVRKI